MILVVKNANYLGCGLGSIEVPIIVSNACIEIMRHYPTYDTEANRKEMQKLMNRLRYGKTNSIWSKLLHLEFPCLSAQVSEAVYNVLANESVFRYGTDYSMLDFANRALKKKESDYRPLIFNIPPTSGGVIMPFVYKTTLTEETTTVYFNNTRKGDARTSAMLYDDNGTKSIFIPQTHFIGVPIVAGNTTNGTISVVSDDNIETSETTTAYSEELSTLSYAKDEVNSPVTSYRVIGLGANLTIEEALVLRTAINLFVDAVMAN